jgi:hypothetical protein
MANSYVIISMTYQAGPADPLVTVEATVNTIPVQVQLWFSVVNPHMGTAVGFQTFMQPYLLAAYNVVIGNATALTPPLNSWSG